jgi:hypothetical protein
MWRSVVVPALALAAWSTAVGAVHAGGGDPETPRGKLPASLSYFALPPCRIVDTRIATGAFAGRIAAGTRRSFNHNIGLAAQGGNAAGCFVPGEPQALAVTLTVAGVLGPGNLRAWAYGESVPNASVVNYGVSGLNLANTTILPVCQGCDFDFTVQADGNDAHLVADVVGYFALPILDSLRCVTLTTNGTIGADSFASITSPACPFTMSLTGGGIDTNFGSAEIWVYKSAPAAGNNAWQCEAKSRYPDAWPFDCYAICCGTWGR